MLDEMETVVQVVATELGVEPGRVLEARSLKDDLGMDSIAAVNILFALEDIYGIDLDLDGADRIDSVAEIAAVLKRIVERGSREGSSGRAG